ncbi:hypothetical protein HJD18_09295 [Thermoleophilia bacterium SCSIO 60948]|nr:hypothetical protein HJD18_09295 [Thermoleophilia bacterium SCSIO 60948]
MPNIGPLEIAIVLIIALIVIGPKKLPSFGRSAGKGLREFKDSVSGTSDSDSGASSAGRSVRELREAIVRDDDDDNDAEERDAREPSPSRDAATTSREREPVSASPSGGSAPTGS